MRRSCFIALALLLACSFEAGAQTSVPSVADQAAIKQPALDYIEGWYEGNAERMERALHPELAKRIVTTRGENSVLGQMSAMTLISSTARGGGKQTPKEKQQKDVTILDI